jgi:hypothetical protein
MTGSERGAYGEVLGKLLLGISDHNVRVRAGHEKAGGSAKEAVAGEVLLSDLYVSRKNPRHSGFAPLSGASDTQGLDDRTDGKFYVVARFECRGAKDANDALGFEASLHTIEGFSSARTAEQGASRMWLLQGYGPDFVPHFTPEWRKDGKAPPTAGEANAFVFWALWLYEPAVMRAGPEKPGVEKAKPAGVAGEEAAG